MKKTSITRTLADEDCVSVRRSASLSGKSKDQHAKDAARPILSAVTREAVIREMDKPRVARSARVPYADRMKNQY
jgi:hypothetical protein